MPAIYDVQDLGSLGGPLDEAYAINSKGQIIGQAQMPMPVGVPQFVPYVWTPNTGMTAFVATVPGASHVSVRLFGLNSLGSLVGRLSFIEPGFPFNSQPFRWDPIVPNGPVGTVTLLPPGDGSGPAEAYSINRAGQVVGYVGYAYNYPGNQWRGGAMWNASHTLRFLPGLGGLSPHADECRGVNTAGQVAMSASLPPGPGPSAITTGRAVLWQPDAPNGDTGSLHPLPLVAGAVTGSAAAINDHGTIAGACWFGGSSTTPRAFRWKPTVANGMVGVLHDLGVLPGAMASRSLAIGAKGEVVGTSWSLLGQGRAFLYDRSMMDLNDLVAPSAGWLLQEARGIDDKGRIVGVGTWQNRMRSFLLVPTDWSTLHLRFLVFVTFVIIGVRDDRPGWVIPPGKGPRPEPWPGWLRPLWQALSPSAQDELRAMALRDPTRLIRDAKARKRLDALVPALRSMELRRVLEPEEFERERDA